MHPTTQHARSKQLVECGVIAGEVRVYIATTFISTHHIKVAFAIKQFVRYQRMQMRIKVKKFVDGMDRHEDGRNTVIHCCANAGCAPYQASDLTLSKNFRFAARHS